MPNALKTVLVGCGGITRAWLDHLTTRDDVQLLGLVDINAAQAERLQADYKLTDAKVGTDLAAMLDAVNPDIVFDCTVPPAHATVAVTALEHGCHVLGEKPMATSIADARRINAAAAKAGKLHAVIQNRRYLDGIVHYRDLIQSGRIGPLTTLNADFYLGPHFGGFREEMEHVLLIDMAIHSLDQARFISGADPVSVYCHEWNPTGSWYAHGASAMAIFEMTNGIVFNYRGSWSAQGKPTSWACDWRAVGTAGTVLWDGEGGFAGEAVTGSEGFFYATAPLEIPPPAALPYGGHAGVINEFIQAVKRGGTPQTVGTDNIKSLAMVYAAIESAERGCKVGIEW